MGLVCILYIVEILEEMIKGQVLKRAHQGHPFISKVLKRVYSPLTHTVIHLAARTTLNLDSFAHLSRNYAQVCLQYAISWKPRYPSIPL